MKSEQPYSQKTIKIKQMQQNNTQILLHLLWIEDRLFDMTLYVF